MKLAAIKELKAGVSSNGPASERIKDLWVCFICRTMGLRYRWRHGNVKKKRIN